MADIADPALMTRSDHAGIASFHHVIDECEEYQRKAQARIGVFIDGF